MSTYSHSAPSKEVQNLLQIIFNSFPSPLHNTKKPRPYSMTPGRFCESCLRLGAIDAKRYTHFGAMDKLLTGIQEERLNQGHDYVTHHLPIEITSYIFQIYTEILNSNFDPQYPTIEQGGPLLLGAVSQSWREIAFNTLHLWNTPNIFIPSTDNLPTKVELTKQWLARSGQLPLSLSLVYRESTGRVDPEPYSLIPLFNVLRDIAPRWRNLVLGIRSTLYTTFIGNLTCVPILDTLTFSDESFSMEKFRLAHTPSLKNLVVFGGFVSQISIGWDNLTTFEANYICRDEFFEVLRLAEQLNSFGFCGFLAHLLGYSLPTTPLTHSALRQLHLESGLDLEPSQLETQLDLAVFPSLEKLQYRCTNRVFFPSHALHSLFNRSHCQLTHFDLSGDLRNGTSNDLISILSDLPTVTHFKLESKYWNNWRLENAIMSDVLLQRLAPTPHCNDTHRLLPCLQSLEFLGYKTFSWSCLANLVSATTSDSGPRLPIILEGHGSPNSIRNISFKVFFREEREFIDPHSIARFKGARDAGISIVIINDAPPHRSLPVPSYDAAGNPLYPHNLLL